MYTSVKEQPDDTLSRYSVLSGGTQRRALFIPRKCFIYSFATPRHGPDTYYRVLEVVPIISVKSLNEWHIEWEVKFFFYQ